MVTKKSWKEFRDVGLLWWVNTMLHMFGWAIVVEMNDDKEITDAYPARVKFRGFDEKTNEKGYQKVSNYLLNNITEIEQETRE